jgi:hypothetical protein
MAKGLRLSVEARVRCFSINAGPRPASSASKQESPGTPAGTFAVAQNADPGSRVHIAGRCTMSQTRPSDTTADATRERDRLSFASAFVPQFRFEQMPGAEERTAYAAEFAAYRLGQIDEKLRRLIDITARGTDRSSEMRK